MEDRPLKNPLEKNKGFTMVELMAAVVIVSVCLVMALRVFSVSAAAVSEAYCSSLALDMLQEKSDALYEKCVFDDGVEPSSANDAITLRGKEFLFSENITSLEGAAEEEAEEGGTGEDAEPESADIIKLCEAEFNISWKTQKGARGIGIKTFLPAKGQRHEF